MIDTATLEQITTIMRIPLFAERIMFVLVGVAGIAGIIMAAMTRADAFDAANRQPKPAWIGILAFASLALLLRIPFISWFAAVAVGIYYFDVRPQLDDVSRGGYGW